MSSLLSDEFHKFYSQDFNKTLDFHTVLTSMEATSAEFVWGKTEERISDDGYPKSIVDGSTFWPSFSKA